MSPQRKPSLYAVTPGGGEAIILPMWLFLLGFFLYMSVKISRQHKLIFQNFYAQCPRNSVTKSNLNHQINLNPILFLLLLFSVQ